MSEFQNNFPNKSIKQRAQILFYLYKISKKDINTDKKQINVCLGLRVEIKNWLQKVTRESAGRAGVSKFSKSGS